MAVTLDAADETKPFLHARLAELVRSRRVDGWILALLTACVTPLLLVGSIVIAMLLLFRGSALEVVADGRAVAWSTLLVLGGMFGIAIFAPLPRWGMADRRAIPWALLPWAGLAGLMWLAGWPSTPAGWMWPPFALLAVLTLALLGRAYEPKERYYLGWFGGLWDDPFSLRDNVDRAHVELGFLVVLPSMLLGAWVDLLGCMWLLHAPTSDDVVGATELMLAMQRRDRVAIRDAFEQRGERAAGRAARLLGHLQLIEPHRDGPLLSARALDMLDAARSEAARGT
jgi:hypothetical protein